MAVQIDNLRGLLGIRRMDKVPNSRIKTAVRSDENIEEGVLRWLSHVENM